MNAKVSNGRFKYKIRGMVYMKITIGGIVGGIIGFAVGYLGKCSSGVCPLTSNPAVSAIIGILMGIMLTMPRR